MKNYKLTEEEIQEMLDTQEPDEFYGFDGEWHTAVHNTKKYNEVEDNEILPF